MKVNRIINSTAKRLFDVPFRVMKGKPRKLAYLMAMRVVDRLFGQNYYDWHTNGEKRFLQCWASLMPSGCVFDVGAHRGDWARIALSTSPSWYVHCFEPNPGTFADLACAGLPSERCSLHNFGFSDKDGQSKLLNYRVRDKDKEFVSSPMSSLFYRHSVMMSEHLTVDSRASVTMKTIDGFCHTQNVEEISLLKIDTEGNEFRVLLGAQVLIAKRRVAAIQFEYDASWIDSRTVLFDVWRLLRQHDYKIYKIASEGLIEVEEYYPGLENFRFSNFVALNAGISLPREQVCMVV